MDCAYIIAGIVLLGGIYYRYLTKNYSYWKKKGVPYIKNTLPGFGNMYPMFFLRKNMFQICEDFYKKMPGCSMVGFYHARQPALLIREPELVKSVLQLNFPSFNSNGTHINPELDTLLSRNPFFLQGEQWKSSRQQLSAAYTSGKLKYMYESIDAVREKFVNYLNQRIEKGNGETDVELKELFSRYTAEVVAHAGFGIEGNSFKVDKDGTFVEIGKTIFEPSFGKGVQKVVAMFAPILARLFNATLIPPEVQKIFVRLVKDLLKYRATSNVQRNDFLQLMINLKTSGSVDHGLGGNFGDDTITSHSASFFIEGYETSSITLSFVCYQLANHPEIQQRLRHEISSILEKHNGITYDALQDMTYMDQVINESMRVYSTAGTLLKVCTSEIDLHGSDGITCRVAPGTPIMISLYGLHRDPEYWPDPEHFDPDRFSEENKQTRHRFTYLPFGEGPRVCVGMRMAMMQVKAAIATTINNYTLVLSPKTKLPLKLDPYYFMASAIGGLWVKVRPLTSEVLQ